MFNISSFFQKFSKIQSDNIESKEVVIKTVKKICGFNIESKNFVFENGILRFNLNPTMKNEIFMRKDKIISEIKVRGSLVRGIR